MMLMRGKCYLRVQVSPHLQRADAVLAPGLLERLGAQAMQLAGLSPPLPAISNRG